MNRYVVLMVLGLAMGGFLIAGCAEKSGHAAMQCAGCEKMKASGQGWCDHCNKGMVAGKPVSCKGCYVAKTGGPACPSCAAKK